MTLLEQISEIVPGHELYVWGGQDGWTNDLRICCVIPLKSGSYVVIDEQSTLNTYNCEDVEEAVCVAWDLISDSGYGSKMNATDVLIPANIRMVVAGSPR